MLTDVHVCVHVHTHVYVCMYGLLLLLFISILFCSHSSFLSSFFCSYSSFLSSYSHSPIHLCLLYFLILFSHHAMNSAGILLYAFTSCVAGYVSARLYRKMNGDNWVWNVILSASMFAGKSQLLLLCACVLSSSYCIHV